MQDFNKIINNFDNAIDAVFQRTEKKEDELLIKAAAYVENNMFLDATDKKMEEALLDATAQEFNDIYESLNDAGNRFLATKNIIYRDYWLEHDIEKRVEFLRGAGE